MRYLKTNEALCVAGNGWEYIVTTTQDPFHQISV